MRILIAIGWHHTAELLEKCLRHQGHSVDLVAGVGDLETLAPAGRYDVIVVAPEVFRLSWLEEFIPVQVDSSVLALLPGYASCEQRIAALDAGADCCGFLEESIEGISGRIRALMRARLGTRVPTLDFHGLTIDLNSRSAYVGSSRLSLTARDISLLEVIASKQGSLAAKEVVIRNLIRNGEWPGKNVVDLVISRLRGRLRPYGFDIRTVKGAGYALRRTPHLSTADLPRQLELVARR